MINGQDFIEVFADHYNSIGGAVVAVGTFVLGPHWWLFAVFLLFNVMDWITGWMKSRLAGVENSASGLKGVIKKFGYWLMIVLSFVMSAALIEIGEIIGVNLQITALLGWFVLASLTVNEIRSILENFVEAGYDLPEVLVKGLSVAQKALDDNDPEDKKGNDKKEN